MNTHISQNVRNLDVLLFLYRPISAPSIPPDLGPLPSSPPSQQAVKGDTHPHKVVRTYTIPAGKSAPSTTTSKTVHREHARVSHTGLLTHLTIHAF